MNALTSEWVKKAEADFATAEREAAVASDPNYDGVCFHSQQCLEKYLKAVLQEAGLPVPRTHDLLALLTLALPIVPTWSAFEPNLVYVTSFAVEFRYPGSDATSSDAEQSLNVAIAVRNAARAHLGITCSNASST